MLRARQDSGARMPYMFAFQSKVPRTDYWLDKALDRGSDGVRPRLRGRL